MKYSGSVAYKQGLGDGGGGGVGGCGSLRLHAVAPCASVPFLTPWAESLIALTSEPEPALPVPLADGAGRVLEVRWNISGCHVDVKKTRQHLLARRERDVGKGWGGGVGGPPREIRETTSVGAND